MWRSCALAAGMWTACILWPREIHYTIFYFYLQTLQFVQTTCLATINNLSYMFSLVQTFGQLGPNFTRA
jgi:hypothetical protein